MSDRITRVTLGDPAAVDGRWPSRLGSKPVSRRVPKESESYAFALPELVDCGRPAPAGVHLVGPAIQFERANDPTDYPWERLDERAPLVYLSLGNIFR